MRKHQLRQGLNIRVLSDIAPIWTPRQYLALNGGTICERFEGNEFYFPKNGWHPPTDSELSALVVNSTTPSLDPVDSLSIFTIPDTLRARFWDLDIEHLFSQLDVSGPEYNSRYRGYLAEIINYLIDDLHLSLSGPCQCETVVHKPGLRSTRYDSDYQVYTGLDIDYDDSLFLAQRQSAPQTARINLGDDPSEFVFINLSLQTIVSLLETYHLITSSAELVSVGAIAKLFMSQCPDYPVAKIILRPGEACLSPIANMIYDSTTLNQKEFSLHLTIRAHFSFITQSI